MKTVIGLFDAIEDAEAARSAVIGSGVEGDRISVVTRPKNAGVSTNKTEAAEGAGVGATAGAVAGGAAGLLASLGALAIPGIGPILAAGAIVATLTGAGLGAAAGGIIGALIGLGIPDHEAEVYAEGIQRGGTLLTVEATDNDADDIAAILSQHNAVDIDKRAGEWESKGWKRHHPDPDAAVKARAVAALNAGTIGGPPMTSPSRGIDLGDVSSAGASIGSVGFGMGEGLSDIGGARRRNARIY